MAGLEQKPMDTYTFSVRNMDLFYDQNQALKNINLDIEKNHITALIGPSGCGKSTFIKTLNRMNDLVEGCRVTGNILFEGKNIFTEIDPLELRYRVGMVFQQPTPFPKSIFENVAYGPRIQGISNTKELEQIVEESLKQAAIWDELKDRLHESALGITVVFGTSIATIIGVFLIPMLFIIVENFGGAKKILHRSK